MAERTKSETARFETTRRIDRRVTNGDSGDRGAPSRNTAVESSSATSVVRDVSAFEPIGPIGVPGAVLVDADPLVDGAETTALARPGLDIGALTEVDATTTDGDAPVEGKYGSGAISGGLGMQPWGNGFGSGSGSGGDDVPDPPIEPLEPEGEGGAGEAEGDDEGGAGEEEGEGDGGEEAGGGAASSSGDEGVAPEIPPIGFDRAMPARPSTDGADVQPSPIGDGGSEFDGTGPVIDLQDRYLGGGSSDEIADLGGRDTSTPLPEDEATYPGAEGDDPSAF